MTPTRNNRFCLAIVLATLTLGTVAVSQETTAPATTTDATTSSTAVEDSLSMGTVPNAPPALPSKSDAEVGQSYIEATFGKWDQRCVKSDKPNDSCVFYQLISDKDGNPVSEISMFALPDGKKAAAGATVIVPLESLLTAGLLLSIDGAKGKTYPFNFCTKQGCIARIGFSADEVEQFKKGAGAVMTIIPAAAPDQKVALDISLEGFSKGYDAVKAANLLAK